MLHYLQKYYMLYLTICTYNITFLIVVMVIITVWLVTTYFYETYFYATNIVTVIVVFMITRYPFSNLINLYIYSYLNLCLFVLCVFSFLCLYTHTHVCICVFMCCCRDCRNVFFKNVACLIFINNGNRFVVRFIIMQCVFWTQQHT
jgi:hypothetical protein